MNASFKGTIVAHQPLIPGLTDKNQSEPMKHCSDLFSRTIKILLKTGKK